MTAPRGVGYLYTGDTAAYGVTVLRTNGATATILIEEHRSPSASIPIGATVTVSVRRITEDPNA